MKEFCKAPFFYVEVHPDGEVYPCCPLMLKKSFGNIFKSNFEEIWNSDFAINFRRNIMNGKYIYCDLNICNSKDNKYNNMFNYLNEKPVFEEICAYPKVVKFCHDYHCNIKCITCRDNFKTNTKEEEGLLNSKIEGAFLPILKNAEIVSLNGSGEALASAHCKKLIKTIAERYPQIKFELHTNGVLCSKKHLDSLGITNRLFGVDISMHGYKKKTVETIMQGTDYTKVMENVKWLSSLKKENKLQSFNFCFVVNDINYKEMEPFAKFALSLGADVYFWEYRKWGASIDDYYDKFAVFEETNPHYNRFVNILKKPVFTNPKIHLNAKLKNLKPLPFMTLMQFKIYQILQYFKLY